MEPSCVLLGGDVMPTSGGTRKIFGGKLYPRKPTIGKQRPSLKKFNLVSPFKKFHRDPHLKSLKITFYYFFTFDVKFKVCNINLK